MNVSDVITDEFEAIRKMNEFSKSNGLNDYKVADQFEAVDDDEPKANRLIPDTVEEIKESIQLSIYVCNLLRPMKRNVKELINKMLMDHANAFKNDIKDLNIQMN